MKAITRFGDAVKPQIEGLQFDYNVFDVVLSHEMGICMIQGYGISNNQYWVENGLFHASKHVTDIVRLCEPAEKKVFLEKYAVLFKAHVDRFFPKEKEPEYYIQHMNHLACLGLINI